MQGNVKRQMSRVGTEQRTSNTAMIETDNGHDQFTARCAGKIQSDRRETAREPTKINSAQMANISVQLNKESKYNKK